MVVLTNPEIASALEGISLVGTKALHSHCIDGDSSGSSSSSCCCCDSSLTSVHLLKSRSCNIATIQQQIDREIPVIDMSKSGSDKEIRRIVRASEELGFFKVINHEIPREVIRRLEKEATAFFSQPQERKDKSGPPNHSSSPYGYGNKMIGPNGDVGWLEYLLMQVKTDGSPVFGTGSTCCSASAAAALGDYLRAVRKLACQVLEMISQGLGLPVLDSLSNLLNDDASDCVFRVNHYPPYNNGHFPQPTLLQHHTPMKQQPQQQRQQLHGVPNTDNNSTTTVTGFGEHTDPQIVSVLRSNSTSGLQICLPDGTWLPVAPDETSFFINVGDALQVLTNGRFRSVRHRVITNSIKSRLSMIFFGAPPGSHRITALPELRAPGEESHYKEFTWSEYKASAYKSRLADDRIALFKK